MSNYVSHEPPAGWEKLQGLFIEKSAYLCTAVDWDSESVNFESLAQVIDYGKWALKECLESKKEMTRLKSQRDELLEALEKLFYAIDCGDEWRICNAQELASDAIAKAKGE